MGILICPFVWEGAALVGLHGMDAAAVVVRKPCTRAVREAPEDQSAAIRRDFRLAVDELLLRHAKERGDTGDLRRRDADDSVLDAAARAALPAVEPWM